MGISNDIKDPEQLTFQGIKGKFERHGMNYIKYQDVEFLIELIEQMLLEQE